MEKNELIKSISDKLEKLNNSDLELVLDFIENGLTLDKGDLLLECMDRTEDYVVTNNGDYVINLGDDEESNRLVSLLLEEYRKDGKVLECKEVSDSQYLLGDDGIPGLIEETKGLLYDIPQKNLLSIRRFMRDLSNEPIEEGTVNFINKDSLVYEITEKMLKMCESDLVLTLDFIKNKREI